MKRLIFTIPAIALAVCLSTSPVQAKDDAAATQLQNLVHQVNQTTRKSNQMQEALHAISIQTGVPLNQVSAMHQRHPNAQPAALLMACVLADNTKTSPETFLKQHLSDKQWAAIAQKNNVPLEKLTVRLQRVQQTLERGQLNLKQRKAK